MLAVLVLPANFSDSRGARELIQPVYRSFPRIKKLFLDGGYKAGCRNWIEETTKWRVEVVKRPRKKTAPRKMQWGTQNPDTAEPSEPPRFQILAWRWIVERTFAWLGRHRRLSKDYEHLTQSSQTWIWIASLRLLLNRLVDEAGI